MADFYPTGRYVQIFSQEGAHFVFGGLDIGGELPFSVLMLDQLTILAPGLLGGSVARAAHVRGVARRIVIWARRPEVREALRSQRWCTDIADTPEKAAAGASLVVLAAPVERIVELAGRIGPVASRGTIVTDVGSVKARVCRECAPVMGPGVHFVGSHPMAGSQKTGWENGSEELFSGRTCFVTPLPDSSPEAVATVAAFWGALGGKVAVVAPEIHDEIVAHISHLPQSLATTLCGALARKDPQWRAFAGGGLRDTTRIAASDATMWIEIFQQNRSEILKALGGFQQELDGFRKALEAGDWPELRRRLESGKAYRDGFSA